MAALRYASAAGAARSSRGHGRAGFRVPRPACIRARRGVALAPICFLMGLWLSRSPSTAIQFTSPMLTGLLSVLVLGERAPRAVWGATLLAFAGVLIVLRPNLLALGPAAFWPLGAAFGMAWLMIFNRKAAGLAPAVAMQLLLAMMAAALLIAAALLAHLSGAPNFHSPARRGRRAEMRGGRGVRDLRASAHLCRDGAGLGRGGAPMDLMSSWSSPWPWAGPGSATRRTGRARRRRLIVGGASALALAKAARGARGPD